VGRTPGADGSASAREAGRPARARDAVCRRRPGLGVGDRTGGVIKSPDEQRNKTMTVYPKESLEAFPAHVFDGYRSTVKRGPRKPLVAIPHTLSELTGPVYGHESVHPGDEDLTKQHPCEPL